MARPLSWDKEKYTKDFIEELYLKENLSRKDLSERLGVSEDRVRRMIDYYKIKKSSDLKRECQKKGVSKKKVEGWYSKNARKVWHNSETRKRILSALAESRTEEWRKNISNGKRGKKQPESQKRRMRELWENGKWDFFRSEEFWKDRRKKYSERAKKQFEMMTDKEKEIWKYNLSKAFSKKACQEKRNATMRKNNSYGKFKQEDEVYERIKKIYGETKRQYRSEDYPYNCDFYIPELSMYIELNLHWTHGRKVYEGTEEDRAKVRMWEEKKTKYYENAIYVWTELDVKKRTVAKEKGLNFRELFSWDECEKFLAEIGK